MTTEVSITVLVENTARRRGLLAEHGLAYWIEFGDRRVLFDTGQGMALVSNARALAIDLSSVDDLVLSHGHYDHTGGIAQVCQASPNVRLVAHAGCEQTRFRRTDGGQVLDVGVDAVNKEALRRLQARDAWLESSACVELTPGLYATGPIPRSNEYEDTGGQFFLDVACTRCDPIIDDQALFFDSSDGLVVLLGCAHSGVINTLDFIESQMPARPVHTVMGGMHLLQSTEARLQRTIDQLTERGIQRYAAGHCTGERAVALFARAFPERVTEFCVGSRFEYTALDRVPN